MKNKNFLYISAVIILALVIITVMIISKPKANNESPKQVETPPQVQKVNDIPLAQRPFVTMNIRPAEKNCEGMDLLVDNFKGEETQFDYFMEYETEKGLIEVINGNRDLTVPKKHDPLLFGTCSSGACTCQQVVDGSLKLTFTSSSGKYILKNDFVYSLVGEKDGLLKSKDLRLVVDFKNILSAKSRVLIGSSFGLPADLENKVVLGPYYLSSNGVSKLKTPAKAYFQSKDATAGKVKFWNGEQWEDLETTVDGDKINFEITQLGVVLLTE